MNTEEQDGQTLSGYALGELVGEDAARVEARLAADPAAAREVAQLRRLGGALRTALAEEVAAPALPAAMRFAFWGIPLAAAAAIAAAFILGEHRSRPPVLLPLPPLAAPPDPKLKFNYDFRPLTDVPNELPTFVAQTMKAPYATEKPGRAPRQSPVITLASSEVDLAPKVYYYDGDPGFTVYAVPKSDAIAHAEPNRGVTITILPGGQVLFNGRPVAEAEKDR